MANKRKKFKEPILKTFQIEKETNQEFNKMVGLLGVTQSQYLREMVENAINNYSNNLNELKQIRNEKINERNLLNQEIEQLNININKLIQDQEKNNNDQSMLLEIMEIIKDVSINENGITKERIGVINKNRIRTSLLIKECKKQGIKIIKEQERINSKMRENTEQEKEPLTMIYNMFKRHYKGQHKYSSPLKLLNADKNKYKMICKKKGVKFIDLKKLIENPKNEKEFL